MHVILLFLSLFFVQLVVADDPQTDFFVSTTGNNTESCGTASSPCLTLNYTLSIVPENIRNTSYNITLIPGIYTGPGNTGLVLQNQVVTFRTSAGSVFNTVIRCDQPNVRALTINASNVLIDGITFENCYTNKYSESDGAAINAQGSALAIQNCVFYNHSGPPQYMYGAAIFFSSGSVDIYNTYFASNVGFFGAAIAGYGTVGAHLKIRLCQFTDNAGYASGYGGAIALNNIWSAVIHDTLFLNNTSGFGGAIYHYGSLLSVTNATFTANTAWYNGGAIFASSEQHEDNFFADLETSRIIKSLSVDQPLPKTTEFFTGDERLYPRAWRSYNPANHLFNNNFESTKSVDPFPSRQVWGSGASLLGWDTPDDFYGDWIVNYKYREELLATASATASASAYYSCTFQENTAYDRGGAIASEKGTTSFWGCAFYNNYAHERGGAIFAQGLSTPFISGSNFTFNRAWKGGALNTENSASLICTNSSFDHNTANYGGILFGDYSSQVRFLFCNMSGGWTTLENATGAVVYMDVDSACTIDSSQISGHQAEQGTLFVNAEASLVVTNSQIHDNLASAGGVIYLNSENVSAKIESSQIWNNSASLGGVIYSTGGRTRITQTSFWDNEAIVSEGCRGIDGYGGVFFFEQMDSCDLLTIDNETSIFQNLAQTAGGVAYWQNPPDCVTRQGDFCVHCTSWSNVAPYGNFTSSYLSSIVADCQNFENPGLMDYGQEFLDYVLRIVPGVVLPEISITVRDGFNNTLEGKHLSVRISLSLNFNDSFVHILGETAKDAVNGTVDLEGLSLTLPSLDILSGDPLIMSIASDPPTNTILVGLLIENCGSGEELIPVGEDGTYVCADTGQLYPYEQNIFISLISIEVLFIFLAGGTLIARRDNKYVMSGSVLFQFFILLGALLMAAGSIVSIRTATTTECVLKIWFMDIGFMLVFGSLFIKTYRLHKIFNHVKLEVVGLKDSALLFRLALMLAYEITVLITWTSVLGARVPNVYQPQCDWGGKAVAPYLLAGALSKVVLICVGVYFTYKVRGIPQLYNESKFIGFAIYNLLMLALVYFFCRLIVADSHPRENLVLESSVFIYAVLSTCALLFLPKMIMLFSSAEEATVFGGTEIGLAHEENETEQMKQLEQTIDQVKKTTLGMKGHQSRHSKKQKKQKLQLNADSSFINYESSSDLRATPPILPQKQPSSVSVLQREHEELQDKLNAELHEVDRLMREKRMKLKNLERLRADFARIGADIAQLQWELDYKKHQPNSFFSAPSFSTDSSSSYRPPDNENSWLE